MWARVVFAVAAVLMLPAVALAQANCALRSPDRQIYEIFPDATAFRTVEATLGRDNKTKIEETLGSSLAHTDEGKHTAYLVLKDRAPIGFVHARTEKGARGSVELVWAFDLDLTIRDFRVQRSRERHTKEIESPRFRDQIIGRDLPAIRSLLTKGNDAIDISLLEVSPEAGGITHTVVLCALKTRVITEMAFGQSIENLRLLGHVYETFPDASDVRKAITALDAATASRIESSIGRRPDQLDGDSITVLAALDGDGRRLGTLTRAVWARHAQRPELWCAVGPGGAIQRLSVVGNVDPPTRQAFAALAGSTLSDLTQQPSDAAPSPGRCALELLALHAIAAGGQ